jgi:hypothetical protein
MMMQRSGRSFSRDLGAEEVGDRDRNLRRTPSQKHSGDLWRPCVMKLPVTP